MYSEHHTMNINSKILFGLSLGLLISRMLATPLEAQELRPNIIFLMSDDQCTYSMGCYGTPNAKTPHLDRLAHEGMVFDNHYDTTAICMASRATVMTGMLEYKTGCNFGHGPLMKNHWQQSYPVQLRTAGYVTAFAGKFGFEVVEKPGQKGQLPEHDFDKWGGGPGQTSYETKKNRSMVSYAKDYPHSTLSYGAFGRDFIIEAAKNPKPFCLSISFKAPHHPVTPDPKFNQIYQGMTFTKPENFGRENGKHFSRQSQQGRQYSRFHDWKYSTDYDSVMAKYYQQIYAIDVAVGMIRSALEKTHQAKNTVIIYTSDNGFLCGSHGYGSKVLPYEEASRVPLILFDPRHSNSGKQLRCQALTGNVDFAPTILELAKLDSPQSMDGKSLLSLYDNPTSSIHESIPLINVWGPEKAHSLAVVTKDWKYIYWPYGGEDFQPTEELYHTSKDSGEMVNIALKNNATEVLTPMRKLYDLRVAHWKAFAVPYNDYQQHGILFDRKLSWKSKRQQVPNVGRNR